jgi:hypothetical protein
LTYNALEDALVYWNLAKRAGLLLYVEELHDPDPKSDPKGGEE